jgi:hypothetical protein
MAESMMLVCDVCGKPEARTVTIRVGDRNLQKDFCPKHLAELVQGARAPKRGRRPGSVTKAKPTTTRQPVGRKSASRKSAARKKSGARKRVAAKR